MGVRVEITRASKKKTSPLLPPRVWVLFDNFSLCNIGGMVAVAPRDGGRISDVCSLNEVFPKELEANVAVLSHGTNVEIVTVQGKRVRIAHSL